ncbi:hypothetical protein INT43_001373 [Umbelopsis isabellina]|uniref:Uncharacterized protein n=1 Tax=Mortierella isabellina TaxID=91625 RepID=A0A8H7PM38_MORIS|nr:hypothetical protein INT43_001373 [Umbelopsis isabellina]
MPPDNINPVIPDVPKVPAPAQPSPLPPEPVSEPNVQPSPPEGSNHPPPDHLPQPPPQSVPPPYKGIRATLREIFEGRNISGAPENNKSNDKWDETCIQWCKQQKDARKEGKEPSCKMVCFRRKVDEITSQDTRDSKDTKDQENDPPTRWNPLRGYSIVVVDGKASCEDHVDDMNKHSMQNPKNIEGPAKYEVDLGEQVEKGEAEAKRLVAKTFTPMYVMTQRYINSWTDGTQAAFFERFAESVKRADAYHIVCDSAKKVYDNTFRNSKGNDDDGKRK